MSDQEVAIEAARRRSVRYGRRYWVRLCKVPNCVIRHWIVLPAPQPQSYDAEQSGMRILWAGGLCLAK